MKRKRKTGVGGGRLLKEEGLLMAENKWQKGHSTCGASLRHHKLPATHMRLGLRENDQFALRKLNLGSQTQEFHSGVCPCLGKACACMSTGPDSHSRTAGLTETVQSATNTLAGGCQEGVSVLSSEKEQETAIHNVTIGFQEQTRVRGNPPRRMTVPFFGGWGGMTVLLNGMLFEEPDECSKTSSSKKASQGQTAE